MIIQGSNNPLVIQFDAALDNIAALVVSLWTDAPGHVGQPLKVWAQEDMAISGDTAICRITEEETKSYPAGRLILEAKGMDHSGNTVFWDEYPIDVKRRRDKVITLNVVL